MRFLRVIGTLLVVSSSANAIFWLFDTLLPIHQVNRLQPTPAQNLVNFPLGQPVLLECHRGSDSVVSKHPVVAGANLSIGSSVPLECMGNSIQVEIGASAIQYLAALSPESERIDERVNQYGAPIVAVGKLKQNKGALVISSDLLAFGNRATYLGELREKSMAQVLWSYALGGMGIAALLIDWQLAQRKRRLQYTMAKSLIRPTLEDPKVSRLSCELSGELNPERKI